MAADWLTVISLIIFGIMLLVLEFVFIPGTTVVGFIGLACVFGGIYLGYDYFGTTTGTIILGSTLVVTVITFYYSLKSGAWERFALKKVIDSKVNEEELALHIGDEGITISALRPIGTAEFKDTFCEVQTLGQYVSPGIRVRVIRTEGRKIWVEALS